MVLKAKSKMQCIMRSVISDNVAVFVSLPLHLAMVIQLPLGSFTLGTAFEWPAIICDAREAHSACLAMTSA